MHHYVETYIHKCINIWCHVWYYLQLFYDHKNKLAPESLTHHNECMNIPAHAAKTCFLREETWTSHPQRRALCSLSRGITSSCKIQHRESSTGNNQQTSRCLKWSIFWSVYNIHIALIHLLLYTKYWHPPTPCINIKGPPLCGFILLQTQRDFFSRDYSELKAEISNQ